MRRLDQSYPLKSTLLYLAVALVVDIVALAKGVHIEIPTMAVFTAGGVLICIPWGVTGAIFCIAIGALFGALLGGALKHLFHRYQPFALRVLLTNRADLEMGLVLVWAVAAAAVFHLTEWMMFPGMSGAIAAANVLLGRALILPELNDLYWLAAQELQEETPAERTVTEARAS